MSYKSIKDWPEEERPRERLLSLGAANLSSAQLLAIILRTGGGGKSAMDLAMEMLDSLKNLKNIESASMKELAFLKESAMQKQLRLRLHLNWGGGFYGT